MFIYLWPLILRWASIQEKCPCARALVIHSIYGQKLAYTKSIIALLDKPGPSIFVHIWIGYESEIWNHVSFGHYKYRDIITNGLGTQNTNLHIMTSAFLWKIDCISVNIDWFSSKFRYVVAKTILYKLSNHHFSFWWCHHSENFD